MMPDIVIIVVAFVAATVNGALGHGFSSLTVPIALLFFSNRILNPALVLVEIAINAWVVLVNPSRLRHVAPMVIPIVLGLQPGIFIGTRLLSRVSPDWLKLATFSVLLPLILLQLAGMRRPVEMNAALGAGFGSFIGILYSMTTISGPPLALVLNNQGMSKEEFRVSMGIIRVAESISTGTAYGALGLYSMESTRLSLVIFPSVVIGIPLGTLLIRWLDVEAFRRVCMGLDALIVSFGLARVLTELDVASAPYAYVIMAAVMLIDAFLLWVYFRQTRVEPVDSTILKEG